MAAPSGRGRRRFLVDRPQMIDPRLLQLIDVASVDLIQWGVLRLAGVVAVGYPIRLGDTRKRTGKSDHRGTGQATLHKLFLH